MEGCKAKVGRRQRRKKGLRKRIRGTGDRPRFSVFRSAKHIYAQIINDETGSTLCEASTRSKELNGELTQPGNVAAAKVVGALLAQRAKTKDIEVVCFDRNGCRFHGRLKGLADAAREGGLKF